MSNSQSSGNGWISALGSLLNSGIGLIASSASNKQQYKYQSKLQAQAAALNYYYGQQNLLNSPTATRKGLVSAGYNPMLAVQNSTSGANSGWTNSGQMSAPDYAGAIQGGISNALDAQRVRNETHVSETQAGANEATARNQNAEASNRELQNPYISRRQEAELGKIEADTVNVQRNTEYFEALEHNLEVMQRLQEMGLNLDYAAKLYSTDKAYNASTYASNKAYEASIENNRRDNRVKTTLEHLKHPYATFLHKGYTSGKDYQGYYKDPWN